MKNNEYFIYEGNKIIMYIGHPTRSDSTRIDVTKAVKLGMAVATKDYEAFTSEKITPLTLT